MLRFSISALVIGLTLPLMAAKCGSDRTEFVGGEVVGDSVAFRALNYQLTSDNYRLWRQAQRALDSVNVDARIRIDSHRLTEDDVDRVVKELETDESARTAIESVGMSARDYVLTTIALAQSWDAVNRPRERFTAVPRENIEFLRRRTADDSGIRTRPRARFLDDSDSDSEDSDDSEGRRRERRDRGGRDSERDS